MGERKAKKEAREEGVYFKILIEPSWREKFHKVFFIVGNLLCMHFGKSGTDKMKSILWLGPLC